MQSSLPSREPKFHPSVFMILIIPFGVVSGYTTVTLSYQLTHAGASVGQVAALVALSFLPQTWKFFWAPVVDLTLNQKKWYLLGSISCALGLAAMGFFPATNAGLAALSAICFLASLASTVLGMAVDSLMTHTTADEQKGRAGGWFQAGNLGGSGLGGGLGLLLAQHFSPWLASCLTGGLCLLCCLALRGLPMPERPIIKPGLKAKLFTVGKDLWEVMIRPLGMLAFLLCFLPLGTGAAPLSAIATEWNASANMVAMITGVLGGVISAVGCLIGGWCCDRMNRQNAYVWFGLIQAASGLAMAFFPRTPYMYMIWASVYAFTSGLTYAAFSAYVLEAIGKGAAATKYNALASLSNVPIYYMTSIDGWAHDKWSSTGMFCTESGFALAGAVIFVVLAKILLRRRKMELRSV